MKKIYVNEKWCLGCHLCEYYCAFAATGGRDMAKELKTLTIRPKIKIEEKGDVCFAVSCRHCDNPLCMKGCIAGAISVSDGVVKIDREKCVGCYTCVMSCPYGALALSDDGAMQKCELCVARGGVPACVEGCPNKAIVFEER